MSKWQIVTASIAAPFLIAFVNYVFAPGCRSGCGGEILILSADALYRENVEPRPSED